MSLRSSDRRPDDHRLAFFDQTALEMLRATGRGQLIQCLWVYEHPIDVAGLQRVNENLRRSLASRLIEPSTLPFGRPRWVRPAGPPQPIRFAEQVRPRAELLDWADEMGSLPIDPEHGPGWRLAVQPFDDGATGVSAIASHVIMDGVGAVSALYQAVTGVLHDPGYHTQGTRPRGRAAVADLRQVVGDLPLTARTAVKAVKAARQQRAEFGRARAARSGPDDPTPIVVPSAALYVDAEQWDAKANSLGGNSYSLLAAFAARLGDRLGRHRPSDGAVSLLIAINTRESLEDDRALAMAFATAAVDPATVTTDLTESRAAVREARQRAKSEPDPTMELLALLPWLPRSAVKGVAELLFSYSEDLPVSCSNLGDLPPEVARVDGTTAEYIVIRALDTGVTLGELQRSHGQLVVVSGRINGKVSISVDGYQLGAENTRELLRRTVQECLADFELEAVLL